MPRIIVLLPSDPSQTGNEVFADIQRRKRGNSVVSALASGARGPRFDPRSRRGKLEFEHAFSTVICRTLTRCPLCRESHPLCRLKNPEVISIWLLIGFHLAARSVQYTPANNARK